MTIQRTSKEWQDGYAEGFRVATARASVLLMMKGKFDVAPLVLGLDGTPPEAWEPPETMTVECAGGKETP